MGAECAERFERAGTALQHGSSTNAVPAVPTPPRPEDSSSERATQAATRHSELRDGDTSRAPQTEPGQVQASRITAETPMLSVSGSPVATVPGMALPLAIGRALPLVQGTAIPLGPRDSAASRDSTQREVHNALLGSRIGS